VRFRIAMTPEDLGNAGLDALGKKWRCSPATRPRRGSEMLNVAV